MNIGKIGAFSALGLQEQDSRSNPFDQQHSYKGGNNLDMMKDVELKMHGTFDSCESINY